MAMTRNFSFSRLFLELLTWADGLHTDYTRRTSTNGGTTNSNIGRIYRISATGFWLQDYGILYRISFGYRVLATGLPLQHFGYRLFATGLPLQHFGYRLFATGSSNRFATASYYHPTAFVITKLPTVVT
jgi:hypothetical protein